MVDRLADVVQQAALLRLGHVGADLGRQQPGQARGLDAVVEHVLPVAGAVLQPADELDELGMQPRHAGVVGGLLPRLAHDDLELLARLGDRLLDPPGMDAAVADELVESHARHLAAHGVEAGQHHRLGRVVDDQVDAGRLLEGADVAPLAADDAALHLLVRQADDGDRGLAGVVGRDALHDGRQDPARSLVPLLGRMALDLANAVLRLGLCLVLDLADELLARLHDRQPGHALELDELALLQLAQASGLRLEALGCARPTRRLLLERRRLAIERLLPVQEAALCPLMGGALLARLFLGRATQVERLVLPLEDDLLLLGARLSLEALRVALRVLDGVGGDEAARHESHQDADDGGDRRHDDDNEFTHYRLPLEVGARIGRWWRPRRRAIGRCEDANGRFRPKARV